MTRPLFEPLFLTDAEIAKRLAMPAAEWAATAAVLERSGLPRKDPLFAERRCWPSVQAFLLRRSEAGAHAATPASLAEGLENLDALRSPSRHRARA